uniref:Uncharacterized protein n=1 Tax=Oryza barthii TaxID=65489 RepID=A0A0D3HN76_9ORYZ
MVAATQLAAKGARVLVLEKYVIPGGSSGYYRRDGFTFDVGSSVMFGFSDKGNLNLITQALEAVGHKMEVIPDPSTVHFHLPGDLSVLVHREYDDFVTELNAGDIARKFIKDQQLLSFIDAEVLCDRHFGGINYPVGGVGGIAMSLADGLVDKGSEIRYKANVTNDLSRKDYEKKKEFVATEIIKRLEKKLFPGLQDSIVLKEDWNKDLLY